MNETHRVDKSSAGKRVRTVRSVASRFWDKVAMIPEHPCWEWVGVGSRNGYGMFSISTGGKRVMEGAHRVSWIIHHGAIPMGMCVLHRCDNRGCVKPEHLFLGTKKENTHDAMHKGKIKAGADHPLAKLSRDQVFSILDMCADGMSQTVVARIHGICQAQVWRIVHGKRWASVREESQ